MFTDNMNIFASDNYDKSKIYIAPLIINAHLDTLESWPKNHRKEIRILRKIASIRDLLGKHFQYSSCSNSYTLVKDTEQPLLRISVLLKSVNFHIDSICIPLQIEIEHIPDGTIQSFSLNSYAYLENSYLSKKSHRITHLFDNYIINFPYTSIISLICSH